MSFSELYESGAQKRNMMHFAIIVKMALVDGAINEAEQKLLNNFSRKLNLSEAQVTDVMHHLDKFSIPSVASQKVRVEYLYELFKMIYIDHAIDAPEMNLIQQYAIGLGFTELQAKAQIEIGIKVFGNHFSFEQYIKISEALQQSL